MSRCLELSLALYGKDLQASLLDALLVIKERGGGGFVDEADYCLPFDVVFDYLLVLLRYFS